MKTKSKKGSIKNYFIFLVIALVVILPNVLVFYADYLWFSSVGYLNIFLKILSWKVLTGIIAFISFFLIVYLNYKLALKRTEREGFSYFKYFLALISLFVGVGFSNWTIILKFLNQTSFNLVDPIFSKDLAFYVFTLPFYRYILYFLFTVFGFSLIVSAVVYLHKFLKGLQEERPFWETGKEYLKKIKNKMFPHTFLIIAILFILVGVYSYLYRFELLFSTSGMVFGAGYTDINVRLPLYTLISLISILVGFSFLLNIKLKNTKLIYSSVALLVGIFILGSVYGVLIQQYMVEPDEYNKEKPFIKRNIENTRKAYNLEKVDERELTLTYNLNRTVLSGEMGTIENIRLWDWRPLLTTYNEIQVFRTYYKFEDVDIDRYHLDGKYREVMLSPREMDISALPENSKSWVNKHLVYTHGYGAVAGPVSNVSEEGLPEFYVKDIPPKNLLKTDKFEINRPELYYGEKSNYYVITNTQTQEFDYPKGQDNVYSTYKGEGGVKLNSFLKRLAFAVKLNSIQILVSGSITPESKVLLNRGVKERVEKIAPFLGYDRDKYIVISDGKLYWIQDAYTLTDRYPYSHPISNFNYIRNSVKTVVNPYSGKVVYYVVNEEPLIKTYKKIFPELFKPISEMPSGLRNHIRYPEDLFKVQTSIYSTYHMEDPRVFYNKEDVWKIPDEIYRGRKKEMEPYYVILDLPKTEREEEFVLMQPFIPGGKENMIGWMAARSDGGNYGDLITYFFSKQKLTYGPMQIESRIDQNTEISEKMSLWGQKGSSVIRGNLLAIPIRNSMLYVEPVFLEGTGAGALPELKRVIVSYKDSIVMEPTLEGALGKIFGMEEKKKEEEKPTVKPSIKELISKANEHYQKAQEALKEGNLAKYEKEIKQIGNILGQLEG